MVAYLLMIMRRMINEIKRYTSGHYINIMARTTDPWGDDLLFGYCHWTGTELVSDDGDSYSVEEEVVKYEFDDYGLAYWFESKWIGANDD